MTATTGKIERSTMLAVVAMALGAFVIANDFTALSAAIPEIERDLGTTLTRGEWEINGYALVFGVLIVTGGRLADLFDRKRGCGAWDMSSANVEAATGIEPVSRVLQTPQALPTG